MHARRRWGIDVHLLVWYRPDAYPVTWPALSPKHCKEFTGLEFTGPAPYQDKSTSLERCCLTPVRCELVRTVLCVSDTGQSTLRAGTVSPAWNITRHVRCFQSSSPCQTKDLINSVQYVSSSSQYFSANLLCTFTAHPACLCADVTFFLMVALRPVISNVWTNFYQIFSISTLMSGRDQSALLSAMTQGTLLW